MLLFFDPYIGYSNNSATYITQLYRHETYYHTLNTRTLLITNRFGDGIASALTSDDNPSFDARTHLILSAKPTTGNVIRGAIDVWVGTGVLSETKQIFSIMSDNSFRAVATGLAMSQQTNIMHTVTYNPDGSISLYLNGTAVATSTVTIPQNTHFRLEFATELTTTGRIRIWLLGNSTPVIDYTGNVTRGLSTATPFFTLGNYAWVYIGMVALWDEASGGAFTGYMGDFRPVRLLPNAAGDLSQSTPAGAPTRHEAVDDSFRNGTADYVVFNTNGQKDLYNYTDLTVSGDILTVIAEPVAWKVGSGGNVRLKNECRSAGIDASSAEIPVRFESISPLGLSEFMVDPATGVAWTQSGLNAAQFGVSAVM